MVDDEFMGADDTELDPVAAVEGEEEDDDLPVDAALEEEEDDM